MSLPLDNHSATPDNVMSANECNVTPPLDWFLG
jgi:hypothetical protein